MIKRLHFLCSTRFYVVNKELKIYVSLIAHKEQTNLERKYQQLQRENNVLQSHVQEKEQKLLKLRTGSYLISKFPHSI